MAHSKTQPMFETEVQFPDCRKSVCEILKHVTRLEALDIHNVGIDVAFLFHSIIYESVF